VRAGKRDRGSAVCVVVWGGYRLVADLGMRSLEQLSLGEQMAERVKYHEAIGIVLHLAQCNIPRLKAIQMMVHWPSYLYM
jgi:hypothetical protein